MRHIRLYALVVLLLFVGCSAREESAYPDVLDLPLLSISELRTTAPVPGRYNVSGVVLQQTHCLCPPDVHCGPCLFPSGALVSATGAPLPEEGYSTETLDVLLVAADDPDALTVGRRYTFSVEIEATQGERPVRMARLLGLRPRG